ncbi:MAG: LptF/LptG family permease [Elusimicrobia bacterium]|nr:LptF/LptG family permease [Elusimicrobiota bacterium]
MPISQKYVLSVFSHFFWLSLFVFASLFVMINFVQIVNQGALSGFSFYFLAVSILYLLPNIIAISLPLSFLMSVLLSLGQLSQDGEIMALRAGGFSFGEILRAMFQASVLACALLLFVNNWLGPRSLKRSTDYISSMINRVTKIELKPRTFQNISDWVIYSKEVDSGTRRLKGVKLVRRMNKNGAPSFITVINAKEGAYTVLRERGIEISLENGQFSQTDCGNRQKLLYGDFNSYKTLIPFFSGREDTRKLRANELSTPGLLKRLKDAALDAETALKYRIEISSRLAMALTPVLFFLIGAPFGVVLEKRGRTAGFALSLLIIFFYYGFSITAMVLAKKHAWLFPWVIFTPGAAAAALGLWLWRKRLFAR